MHSIIVITAYMIDDSVVYHLLVCAVVTVIASLSPLLPVTSFTATTVMEYVV